jgi:hypothetical protein
MRLTFLTSATLVLCSASLDAQTFREAPVTNEAWTRPMPGFRIVGNIYYVGT